MKSRERRSKSTCRCLVLLPVAYESIVLYCIVLYWFEAAPPAAADKGFARFRSYIPNLSLPMLLYTHSAV